ncbi:CAP domain-containing protein [Oricola sp.]|uniref:CAP domain-containing protein n=1 Tax=Oricola sp. TaxID=1979950 RepID=UPI003BABF576
MISRRRFVLGAAVACLASGVAACTTPIAVFEGPVTGAIATGAAIGPVNAFRAENGLSPLAADDGLSIAARQHAEFMARRGRLSHAGFRGRMRRAGAVFPAAENVAMGQTDADAAVVAWSQSAGHRRNMLGDYARVGVARAERAGGRPYWVMVLAN